MTHHKNRKPKAFKGCCLMCSLRGTDGRRCGRTYTVQELRAAVDDDIARIDSDLAAISAEFGLDD